MSLIGWKFSDKPVSWELRLEAPKLREGVDPPRLTGPAILVFFPTVDQKRPKVSL